MWKASWNPRRKHGRKVFLELSPNLSWYTSRSLSWASCSLTLWLGCDIFLVKTPGKKTLTEIREIGCSVFLSTYQPNPVPRTTGQVPIRRIWVCLLFNLEVTARNQIHARSQFSLLFQSNHKSSISTQVNSKRCFLVQAWSVVETISGFYRVFWPFLIVSEPFLLITDFESGVLREFGFLRCHFQRTHRNSSDLGLFDHSEHGIGLIRR